MKNKSAYGVVALGMLLGGVFANAQAATTYGEDAKSVSGSQCLANNGTQWPDFVVNADGIRNISTGYRYVTCPFLMDSDASVDQSDFDGTTPNGYLYVRIWLDYGQAPATASETICTMVNRNRSTNVITTQAMSVSSVRTTSPVTIEGIPAGMDGISGYFLSGGTFSFTCRLPSKVKLTAIQTYEKSQTDRQVDAP